MVEVLDQGIYLLKGQVVIKDADKLSLVEINNRLAYEGLTPL